jgi:hypothetical protein
MAEQRWAVVQATGEWLYGGTNPYDCEPGLSPGQIRVVVQHPPNPRLERYTGNPDAPFRNATPAEIVAWDAAVQNERAEKRLTVDVRATILWALTRILGRTPTAAERQTARDEWKAIRKSLD